MASRIAATPALRIDGRGRGGGGVGLMTLLAAPDGGLWTEEERGRVREALRQRGNQAPAPPPPPPPPGG